MENRDHVLYKKFRLQKVFIPRYVLLDTEKYLKEHGLNGNEGMVLWSGKKMNNEIAAIKSCIHPQQNCTPVSFEVSLDESQRINVLLEHRKEIIIAQVHSHPGIAFHSATDDNFPFTFTIGLFSIVAPNFCKKGLRNLQQCRIWEHIGFGKWRELKSREIEERFIIFN